MDLFMGNSSKEGMVGKGKVSLHPSFGKTPTLTDVFYVPKLNKNLIYGYVLINNNKASYDALYC